MEESIHEMIPDVCGACCVIRSVCRDSNTLDVFCLFVLLVTHKKNVGGFSSYSKNCIHSAKEIFQSFNRCKIRN